MALAIRRIEPDELTTWARAVSVPFSQHADEDDVREDAGSLDTDRCWAAVDGTDFVGTSAILSRNVTVPGLAGSRCEPVPFAAITAVGVHPTHRRQGLLCQMMSEMFADGRRRGEALAGLMASEGGIYGRFGFGLATLAADYEIDTGHAGFRVPGFTAADAPARVRLVGMDEAAKVVPDMFDGFRRTRPGEVNRTDGAWEPIFRDKEKHRGGASARFYAIGEECFAIYRSRRVHPESWVLDYNELRVSDLYGGTFEAEASLWRFLFDVDLVEKVTAFPRPVDDLLRFALKDPRRLRAREVTDYLWIRVLDTEKALTSRRYGTDARLVIDLRAHDRVEEPDPALGRWVLETSPEAAECRRASAGEAADIAMGLSELGSLLLGGFAPSALARAGLAQEESAGKLAVADQIFSSPVPPFCGTDF